MKVTLKQAIEHYKESSCNTKDTMFYVCKNATIGNKTLSHVIFNVLGVTNDYMDIVRYYIDNNIVYGVFDVLMNAEYSKLNIIENHIYRN